MAEADENEKAVEEEIEKLAGELEQMKTAIEELNKAKDQTESKLKDEIKKAKELHKWKRQRIDQSNSKTLGLLNEISILYDEMFCMHENCDLNDKTQDVMESYRNEFIGLVNLYEKLAIGFLKPTQKKYGCPCQLEQEDFDCNEIKKDIDNDSNYFEGFIRKKCSCPEMEEFDMDEEEEEEEEDEYRLPENIVT